MSKKNILDYFKIESDDQNKYTDSDHIIEDKTMNKKICLTDKNDLGKKQSLKNKLEDINKKEEKFNNYDNKSNRSIQYSDDINVLSDINKTDFSMGFYTSDTSCKNYEERFEFMKDIRDKNGIRKGELNYDPKTLYISETAFSRLTPFEKQFWAIKKEHFDTVIMFKKGAFYELYEDDAELTSKLFDFKVSGRVNMKMTGFPEKSFDQWARKLIDAGYKIGRVEQTENMIGKKMREENKLEKDTKNKIIERQLKEIVTSGTVYKDEYLKDGESVYVAVIKECSNAEFVVILYEASVNKIWYSKFGVRELKDIFAKYNIIELIAEKRIIGMSGMGIITPIRESVVSRRKYELEEEEYECYMWLYNYMKSLCREECIEKADICKINEETDSGTMVLDGATIINLDILKNNYDENEHHSLFEKINYCSSAFGRRLLRKWIVCPLRSVVMIEKRRRYVQILQKTGKEIVVEKLRKIGDVERMLGKIFNISPTVVDLSKLLHAIENMVEFLTVLVNFVGDENLSELNYKSIINEETKEKQIEKSTKDSEFMKKGILEQSNISENDFKNEFINKIKVMAENLRKFLNDFYKMYKVKGDVVLPGEDDKEYFQLNFEHHEIEKTLKNFIESLRRSTGCNELQFRNINKDIFQIEAPAHQKLPDDFYVVSSTKTLRRFYSSQLKIIIKKFQHSEERLFQAKMAVFHQSIKFIDCHRLILNRVINFVATVDCFLSFAIFNSCTPTTCPVFSVLEDFPIELRNFRNPIFQNYIENSYLPKNKITLVSGPNMGGKSTFLRSICLNIILAQMGLNVFCEYMQIPVFDRIFTRIGASDSLVRGESTFMQEISETSRILHHSSSHSFVIIDELGRGTSTQDGNAIARAVLDYLTNISCYTLFSTHYHRLISHYPTVDKIYLDSVMEKEDILFLYKAKHGVCPDSHALYVAKMAGIPNSIVKRAIEIKKILLSNNKSQV